MEAPVNYRKMFQAMTTPQLISDAWASTVDPKVRDRIVTALVERERRPDVEGGGAAAWPSGPMAEREEMAGLYPDPADPEFPARLYQKREFYEARAIAAGVADGSIDPCSSKAAERVFELTPVQRIVSRFLHPLTPYMGMLLFHGVGVGKTCSAVSIAEQFLEVAPTKKVIVIVPQALQSNFKNTVFDMSRLVWNEETKLWSANQCTGISYLERLGLLDNPDVRHVQYKVEEDRRARYSITGYQAFANWVQRTLEKRVAESLTDPVARLKAENEVLRRLFSDTLIIVDEAHNLRDLAADGAGDAVAKGEEAENAGGKALNPFLRRIVLNAEGLRLVLMTATPMYNSAPEIVLLLNYLLLNDTKSEASRLKVEDIFSREGKLIAVGPALRALERAARRYVSYMRGENPFSFPLRMRPAAAAENPADSWPAISASKRPVDLEGIREALNAMPLVFSEPVPGSVLEGVLRESKAGAGGEGAEVIADAMLDYRMQMGNMTYPNGMFGTAGWDYYFDTEFKTETGRKLRHFKPSIDEDEPFNVDSVFAGEGLRSYSPKIHRIVESVRAARGICFVYSRYIKTGALPLAVALERAGFQRRLADGRLVSLLSGIAPVAPICALCGAKKHDESVGHKFAAAAYVLLTSEDDISPSFAGLVRQATTWSPADSMGPLGTNVKVVIGSQVASEGLDLKCIREMHVMDAWYHLNRTDQIIGRAIRYCSHAALRSIETAEGLPSMSLNNCLIYLHALRIPETEKGPAFESADMYAYRIAIHKALMVGEVQRVLKKNAWDCNLELEAISFAGLPKRYQVDAQGRILEEYSIDDQDYTTYCDYQKCSHECRLTVNPEDVRLDSSTYSLQDARRQILQLQDAVRRLFADQVMVPETVVQEIFADLPWEISSEALMELIDGRKFRLRRPDGTEGFLIKKAGYLVFQPAAVKDTEIPMSLRYSRAFQLRRRFMTTGLPVLARAEEPVATTTADMRTATAAPAAGAGEPVLEVVGISPTILEQWNAWYAFMTGAGPLPRYLPSTMNIWNWILHRYAAIPEMKTVGARWWLDRLPYTQLRSVFEYVLNRTAGEPIDAMEAALTTDIFRSAQVVAYRIYNPDATVMGAEYWCRPTAGGPFRPCSSAMQPIIAKQLGSVGVPIPDGVGTLFGFLAAKTGRMVFKTLDTTKPKKHSSSGAECGNTSNLGEHHPRIRLLHEAGRTSVALAELMLPDEEGDYDAAGAKKRMEAGRPEHMKDITHQPLCLYMEVLCRILDAEKVMGRRWFLSAVEAAQSGLKGKK
jgi:hypothetical protein